MGYWKPERGKGKRPNADTDANMLVCLIKIHRPSCTHIRRGLIKRPEVSAHSSDVIEEGELQEGIPYERSPEAGAFGEILLGSVGRSVKI